MNGIELFRASLTRRCSRLLNRCAVSRRLSLVVAPHGVAGCTIGTARADQEMSMATAKEQMARIIEAQPEDSSYEEILRELAFDRGVEDSEAGRTVGNREM